MRTERKSNNNIFENNLSNCLITFTLGFHNFGLCLIKPILRFIEKLASYNFCENGTYRAVTLAGHDNALFFWNLRIKKHPQIIHSQNPLKVGTSVTWPKYDHIFRCNILKNHFRHLKLYSNSPSWLAGGRCQMGTFWKTKDWNACTQAAIRFILQRNTKFYSCTQTVIRFLQWNTIFRIIPNGHLFFLQRNTKFWKLHLKAIRFYATK